MLEVLAAWRGLRKNQAGIALAIVTLAVASCFLTTVFTVVSAVLVRPLPVGDADRVAVIWERRSSEAGKYGVSGADFYDWQQAASKSAEFMTAQDEHPMVLGGEASGTQPERILAVLSTPGLLETFGVNPIVGREGQKGQRAAVVRNLATAVWRRCPSRRTDDPPGWRGV